MSNVLITWELGGGLGHLIPIRLVVERLLKDGHSVTLAIRDLSHVQNVFGSMDIRYLQAPFLNGPIRPTFDPPISFAHILHNIGFGDPNILRGLVLAWRSIYDLTKPDVVLFDHSPTAILAARGYGFSKALIGIGFFYPIDTYPMSPLRPCERSRQAILSTDEDQTTHNVNEVLRYFQLRPVDRLGQIYGQIETVFLQSYAELDHFGVRPHVQYVGVPTSKRGAEPCWPHGSGPKLFAYLKAFHQFDQVIERVASLRIPTIVCCSSLDAQTKRNYEKQYHSICFETQSLNMTSLAEQCDVGINHANHGTLCALLKAGKPVLMLPLQLEQRVLSQRICDIGAGILLEGNRLQSLQPEVERLCTEAGFRRSTELFKARYGNTSLDSIDAIARWIT